MRFYKIAVLFIILSGLLLRLFKFQDLFYFAIDEEKAAYIIKGIIDLTHFPTVGYPSSIGFRLGPLVYYLVSPFYKIFGSYPFVWGYLTVAVSLASMLILFKMSKFIGMKASILALILYAFSYLNVLYDRRGWPVSFHSFIALIILYSLLKLKNNKTNYIYLLTLVLIFASHFEVATLLFIPLILIIIILFKINIPKKHALTCIFLFLLSQIGLLVFDLKHSFINSKYLINYFRSEAVDRIAPNVSLTGIRSVYLAHNLIPNTFARTLFASTPSNVAIQYANCPHYLNFKQSQISLILKLFILLILASFFYTVYKNRSKESDSIHVQKIILIYLLLLFGGTTVYTYIFHGEMAEYYMLSAFAYFFIMLGMLFQGIKSKIIKLIIYFLILLFIFDSSYKMLTSYNPYGWKYKQEAVKFSLDAVQNKNFTLESFQTCWSTGGYRYLYTLNGHEPLRSYMDQYLGEYYKPNLDMVEDYKIILITPELIGSNPSGFDEYKRQVIQNAVNYEKFGEIEMYIIPNQKKRK